MRLDPVTEEIRPSSAPLTPSGTARFAANGHLAATERELRARRFLWVGAPESSPPCGQLRAAIEEAVELALAMRGALPPRVEQDAALDAVIADQVFRAKALGAAGLAVAVPSLCAGAGGELDRDDSAALLAWLTAAREAPIALLFHEADRPVRVLAPVSLAELVGREAPRESAAWGPPVSREQPRAPYNEGPPRALADAARAGATPARAVPAPGATVRAAELVASDLGEALGNAVRVDIEVDVEVDTAVDAPAREAPPASGPAGAAAAAGGTTAGAAGGTTAGGTVAGGTAGAAAAMRAPRTDGRPRGVLPPRSGSRVENGEPRSVRPVRGTEPPGTRPSAYGVRAGAPAGAPAQETAAQPANETTPVAGQPARAAGEWALAQTEGASPEPEMLPPTRRELRSAPQARVLDASEWRSLAIELDNARGPKPVRVIEQLFATHYTPLLGATMTGETDAAVRGVVDAWRASFEHSYRDAFSALRVTGKRPHMVFDAPDMAARIGRLNGARGVKLLLVDAMRFDLGERVAVRLKEMTQNRAVLVERSLLWSALPTTTAAQLALLGRGPEGLRDVAPPSEPEPAIARGRAVATLRRERVGARELMKLDLVEARLRSAGPAFAERIEAIADEVADVVGRFIESLPPRTLLLVFGDHGFRMTPQGDGSTTGPATQGGSSPEEVLVPAQAWLVGGVH